MGSGVTWINGMIKVIQKQLDPLDKKGEGYFCRKVVNNSLFNVKGKGFGRSVVKTINGNLSQREESTIR